MNPCAYLQSVADRVVSEGIHATGVQLTVSHPGLGDASIRIAAGRQVPGRKMTSELIFNLWCASKPVVACAFIALADELAINSETRLGHLIDGIPEELAAVRWGAVLNHNAGLERPGLFDANLNPVEVAESWALSIRPDPTPAYSEFVYNVLLAVAIEKMSGREADAFLGGFVRTLGLEGQLVFSVKEHVLSRPLDTLGFYIYGLPSAEIPLYHDATPIVARLSRARYGAYGSASGLCGFYRSVGRVLQGETVAGLPLPASMRRWLGETRGEVFDPVLQRTCDFGAGLMVNLRQHGFGQGLSKSSLGHAGLHGCAFGFHEPERALSVGAIFNGMVMSDEGADARRTELIGFVLESVDAL